MTIRFERTVPILRIFSEEKAKEFYLGFLGFKLDWEHRFETDAPLYMQVSRAGMVLHLSEHHGDGAPGATLFVETAGLDELHAEVTAKKYRYLKARHRECALGRPGDDRHRSLLQPHPLQRAQAVLGARNPLAAGTRT